MTSPTTDDDASPLVLGGSFEPAGRDEWRALVAQVLRKSGRLTGDEDPDAPEDLIGTRTDDGVDLRPLYTRDDATAALTTTQRLVRADEPGDERPGWHVRQRHAGADPVALNEQVLRDLENGTTALWLQVGGPGGLAVGDLPRALAGVVLDLAPVAVEPGGDALNVAGALLDVAAAVPPAQQRLVLGLDPLGARARFGDAADERGLVPAWQDVADLLTALPEDAPGLRTLVVDATAYHDAGAGDVAELASSIATAVTYLRELAAVGTDPAVAAAAIEFRYAATADQFATIAKLRAARALWARVCAELGVEGPAAVQQQHAVTSWPMTAQRDPYVNVLRSTVAAFAAGVGGADAVTVLPFDAAVREPVPSSLRLARNTQSLLLMEAHLGRVRDAAGGSWYVESRTEDLARAAWERFTGIEADGGMAAVLASGAVAGDLAAARERRAALVATRRVPLTGVSEFPDLDERPLAGEPAAPWPADDADGLPRIRWAQPYEALRDRSDAALAATGSRPSVLLVTLGTVAASTARATFATNLLAAGGLRAVPSGQVEQPQDAAAAAREHDLRVAVLAGRDEDYTALAAPVAAALREAGVTRVLLAGRADVLAEADRDAVDGTLAVGTDVPALAAELLDYLEVP